MYNSTLPPTHLPCQSDESDILHRLALMTGLEKPPHGLSVQGRFVWGSLAGGIHIEIIPRDDCLTESAMNSITHEEHEAYCSKERWTLYCNRKVEIAHRLNQQIVNEKGYVVLLRKNGQPTKQFQLLFGQWCMENYKSLASTK